MQILKIKSFISLYILIFVTFIFLGCTYKDKTQLLKKVEDLVAEAFNVKSFNATGWNKKVKLTWNNPSNNDFKGVIIVKKEGSIPENIDDGEIIYNNNGDR